MKASSRRDVKKFKTSDCDIGKKIEGYTFSFGGGSR
jgi:hypothetical protein